MLGKCLIKITLSSDVCNHLLHNMFFYSIRNNLCLILSNVLNVLMNYIMRLRLGLALRLGWGWEISSSNFDLRWSEDPDGETYALVVD